MLATRPRPRHLTCRVVPVARLERCDSAGPGSTTIKKAQNTQNLGLGTDSRRPELGEDNGIRRGRSHAVVLCCADGGGPRTTIRARRAGTDTKLTVSCHVRIVFLVPFFMQLIQHGPSGHL